MWKLDGKYVRNMSMEWVLTLNDDYTKEDNLVILTMQDSSRKSQLWTYEDGFLVNEVRAPADKKVYITTSLVDNLLCTTHSPTTRWIFTKDGFLQIADRPAIVRGEQVAWKVWSKVKAYDHWVS